MLCICVNRCYVCCRCHPTTLTTYRLTMIHFTPPIKARGSLLNLHTQNNKRGSAQKRNLTSCITDSFFDVKRKPSCSDRLDWIVVIVYLFRAKFIVIL